mmetsp:Transcript_68987/g.114643  ORF Transcript_68987/g.114643 Transcript_68987/m.114643 type:complete len:202 (-) Transcript_68987:3-608(-)
MITMALVEIAQHANMLTICPNQHYCNGVDCTLLTRDEGPFSWAARNRIVAPLLRLILRLPIYLSTLPIYLDHFVHLAIAGCIHSDRVGRSIHRRVQQLPRLQPCKAPLADCLLSWVVPNRRRGRERLIIPPTLAHIRRRTEYDGNTLVHALWEQVHDSCLSSEGQPSSLLNQISHRRRLIQKTQFAVDIFGVSRVSENPSV